MKTKFKSIIFILVLGSVCTGLLLSVRYYTLPIITKYQEITLKGAILEAAGIPYDKDINEAFGKNIKKKEKKNFVYYLSPGGQYIFEFRGQGLWGIITGLVALNPDLVTIRDIVIISQEETPGLGGRIGEKQFLDQFSGKKADPVLTLALRQKASRPGEIDSITGATLSSKALVNMISKQIEEFRGVMGEK